MEEKKDMLENADSKKQKESKKAMSGLQGGIVFAILSGLCAYFVYKFYEFSIGKIVFWIILLFAVLCFLVAVSCFFDWKAAKKVEKLEADARNEADQTIFACEKSIKDLKDKLTDKEKEETQKLIDDLKESLKGTDVDDIKDKTSKLNEKAMEFATRVYNEAGGQANQSGESDDEPAEAEFVNK